MKNLKKIKVLMILSLMGFFVSSQSTTIDITESFQPVLDMIGVIAPIAYALIPALIGFGILSIIGGFVAMVVGIFTILPKVFNVSVGLKKK